MWRSMGAVSSARRTAVLAVLLLGTTGVAACGGSSGGGTSGNAATAEDGAGAGSPSAADIEAAGNILQSAVDDTPDEARAIIVIDGATYTFRPIQPGPDDDFYSFCTVVAGSLQGSMQLVDAAGQRLEGVDGGEIDFVFLEPGGAYESTGDPPELTFTRPDVTDGRYMTATEIDAPLSGRRATGTFTATDFFGENETTGTIDASC